MMHKLIAVAFFVLAAFAVSFAQETRSNLDNLVKLARAPKEMDGLGRAVVIVTDEAGNPIKAAYVHLHSFWGSPKQHCESWDVTNEDGATALLPIHMGRLKLVVKMKGFQKIEIPVQAEALNAPIKVTLVKKKGGFWS
jgi:hypothetical protein